MASLTVALMLDPEGRMAAVVESIAASPAVSAIILAGEGSSEPASFSMSARAKSVHLHTDMRSGAGIAKLLEATRTDYLLLLEPGETVRFTGYPGEGGGIERMLAVALDSGAGLVYSDYLESVRNQLTLHPLIDYQYGSIRDNFELGAVVLLSKSAAVAAQQEHGLIDESLKWGGFYDLRLKLSDTFKILRIPEPLYVRVAADQRDAGERQFDYVDPKARDYQLEMEQIATAHLERVRAHLEPEFENLPPILARFPVEATIVIPVRNRVKTIRDAVISAVSQLAPFDYNVMVIDNHSTDGTSPVVARLAREYKNVMHIVPASTDLGIGGCWNEAIYSHQCGAIAVQLDSDDVYSDPYALGKIVSKFDEGPYAMVIGSYKITDFDLNEIPPGLIDHREWTRENGRNNALRINGLGAPRAYYVPVIRHIGFPNTSYGEDYAVGLRISRQFEIGRIYEPLYYARRWEGNSDAKLDVATANRYDAYKDTLRTIEIHARQRMNQQ
ncbi:MAG TPA: glycosyltransferase family 2 protein [Blastocatellia bacterium]|nr:glycosyltransferase family 2 protein [Blastocatellia bacterium]